MHVVQAYLVPLKAPDLTHELQTAEGSHVRAGKAARALTSEPSLQSPSPTSYIVFPTVNTLLSRERLHGFLGLQQESNIFKVSLITRFLHERGLLCSS